MAAVFVLIAIAFIAFVKEWAGPDVVALSALALVIGLGILDERDVLSLFSNSAPITIGAMFVLSAALTRTGAIDVLARSFTHAAGRSELRALALLALIVVPLSGFINNTPVVVVFLPILLAFSRSSGVKSSKLLLPLSYFAILGGTITLIGTSTNLLVAGVAADLGIPPIGIFEISKIGIIYAVIGVIYMLTIGRKLLPDRETLSSILSVEDTRSFCSQAIVGPDSPLIGKELQQTTIGKSNTTRVFEIIRSGRREFDVPIDQVALRAGDVLVFKAHARGIAEIQETVGLRFDADDEGPSEPLLKPTRELTLVEAIIGPNSRFLGKTIQDLRLRRTYGVVAAALHRRGTNLFERFQDIPLAFGDTVLFEGPTENINKLQQEDDFLSLNETADRPFRMARAPIAIAAILGVVVLAALNVMPIVSAALIAAVVVVLTGCLDPREAYESVEWKLLFLIIGMLGLGKAMEVTGGVALIANQTATIFAPFGPFVLIAAIYLVATVLTELVTNNAVAIILTPVVIGIAQTMGVDPMPFIITIMLAASSSLISPIGYQTNTYVFGAGGYKFSDFPKVGLPLNLILWATATLLIPIFWKL